MSNVKILYEGLETAAFMASAGTATGYDIDNLANRNPNSRWRSGATTNNQTLRVELAVARPVNTVIIDGHNMDIAPSADLDLNVEWSDDGATGWTSIGAKTDGEVPPIIVYEFAAVTKKYWRIRFSQNSGSFALAPEVGNIFIGTRLEPAYPYDAAIDRGEKFSTVSTRSLNATPYAVQKLVDGIEGWKNMKWTNSNDAIANGFIALNSAVRGSGRPFYFIDTDDVARLVLIVGDTIQIKPIKYNVNDVQLELQAFLTGTISAI